MAIYFVDKYQSAYSKMENEKSTIEYGASIESCVNEIDSEIQGVMELLEELDGNYTGELKVNLKNFLSETKNTYTYIVDEFKSITNEIGILSNSLSSFKAEDEKLEIKTDEQTNTENTLNNTPQYIEEMEYGLNKNETTYITKTNPIYIEYAAKLEELKIAIEEMTKVVLDYKSKCDTSLTAIDKFNDAIVDIRIKVATIATMNQGYTIEEINSMTPEEKEALIARMINEMTEKYNTYKSTYETYYQMMINEDYDSLNDLYALYNNITGDHSFGIVDLNMNAIPSGLRLVDFIQAIGECNTKDGRNIIDCIDAYNKGESWVDSGLAELYREGHFYYSDDYSLTDEQYEQEFLYDLDWYYNNDGDEVLGKVVDYYRNNLQPNSEIFEKNYEDTVRVGVAIQGLKELNGHVKYDAYSRTEGYQSTEFNSAENEEFLNKIYFDTNINLEKTAYMTDSELKMFKYLYENNGESAAAEYISSINQTLNRREGYIRASAYYYDLVSGNNTGLEAVWDHLSVGATGYGDGISGFVDGFVDLVAPEKELSANEYAQTALVGYLTEGGTSYDNTLLLSYNIGNTAGKKTIPMVLNLVKPGLGTAAEIISDYGNNIETYFGADENATHGGAALRALQDLAADKGVEYGAKILGLDTTIWGKAGVKFTQKFLGEGVKVLNGEESTIDISGAVKGSSQTTAQNLVVDSFCTFLENRGISKNTVKTLKSTIIKPAVGFLTNVGTDSAYEFGTTLYETQGDWEKATAAAQKKAGSSVNKNAAKSIVDVGSGAINNKFGN
jgi:hypothetical protein